MNLPGIRLLTRHYLFWLINFLFFRLIFWVWQGPWGEELPFGEMLAALYAGWRLDLSTAGYLFIVPFLLHLGWLTTRKSLFTTLFSLYSFIAIAITVILQTGNIAIYRFWGVLLNNRAVAFAADPAEVAASLSTVQFIAIFVALAILTAGFVILWRRMVKPAFECGTSVHWKNISASFVAAALTFLCIRGGVQQIPINESSSYYSQNTRLNHIAVNSLWHLANSIRQASISTENPYAIIPDEEAAAVTKQLLSAPDSTEQILKRVSRPNVVIIILESWTADIIEPLSGQKGITPFFSTLCNDGILFTDIYSSGFRTDQGIISVLSGFPSQPNKSIIRFPDKTSQLPCLARSFAAEGYQTSFYYGGELGFANMKSYLLAGGFKSLTGKDDFASENMNSKWGAHDGVVLSRQLQDLRNAKEPFFSVLLTLSTHEPFEVPVKTPFNGTSEPELFKKAAWYTDKSLQEYFEKASKESWYSNTLFVLVADHGHRLPLNRAYEDPMIRHIPLLITGALIKPEFKGNQMAGTGCQHDIPATILKQLSLSHTEYSWSTNLLNNNRNRYAYQSLDESIYWITPEDTLFLKIGTGQQAPASDGEKQARAFLQRLYGEFMRL